MFYCGLVNDEFAQDKWNVGCRADRSFSMGVRRVERVWVTYPPVLVDG